MATVWNFGVMQAKFPHTYKLVGRKNVDGLAARHGLEGPGIESR